MPSSLPSVAENTRNANLKIKLFNKLAQHKEEAPFWYT